MITYDTGKWSIMFALRLRGSVFPRACLWAILSAALAVIVNFFYFDRTGSNSIISSTWFSYSFLLSFLVVFRTQQAYARYWEGASTLCSVRGDFVNAASCIFAFCSSDSSKKVDVLHFQHHIVRLMSLLHCSGLQQVASMADENFEVVEVEGLDAESIEHLNAAPEDRAVIVLQWVQKLVLQKMKEGVLDVSPPIASRVFQQLGQGVMQLAEAKKISEIPFPFPYTQMVTLMLIVSSFATPTVVGLMIESPRWCASLTFLGILGFWAINYIAAEIEMPFGDDRNDLPMAEMQIEFNRTLRVLLAPLSQSPPTFVPTKAEQLDHTQLSVVRCVSPDPTADGLDEASKGMQHMVSHKLKKALSLTLEKKPHGVVASPSSRADRAERGSILSPSGAMERINSVRSNGSARQAAEPAAVQTQRSTLSVHERVDGSGHGMKELHMLGARMEEHLIKVASDVAELSANASQFSKNLPVFERMLNRSLHGGMTL